MTRPRLLDLFCGAGGCSVGYHRAGFDVVGVDINPQPRYPFEFHQADALTFPLDGFDAVHASPPCQAHTIGRNIWHTRLPADRHPDLLAPMRERLEAQPAPWAIENVPGAPMRRDLVLCGTQFGLGVRRHRWFELSWPAFSLMPPCWHHRDFVIVFGGGAKAPRRGRGFPKTNVVHEKASAAMGIDWMRRDEMSQAIPPAYTEHIGRQLLAHLEAAA